MRALKMVLAALTGLVVYMAIAQRPLGLAFLSKALGGDQPCPWSALVSYPWTVARFAEAQINSQKQLIVEREDPAYGIELIRDTGRAFWIRKNGAELGGKSTLAYVIAEQEWVSSYAGKNNVQPGDIVVDVGAHVGTFDTDALRRGAAKTILVEPDPTNLECIRRNFKKEIADGRVVVVPEGAWSSRSTLQFSKGAANSGSGSFVLHEKGSQTITVPVRPLDEILAELHIGKVDYIKMDIEGAEREALKGARKTLARWKPVLMLDFYHLPDDDVVLPRIILAANRGYRATCDVCSPDRLGSKDRFVPYVMFYR